MQARIIVESLTFYERASELHLSHLSAGDRFSFLMTGQLGFPAEYYPLAFARALPSKGPIPE